MCDTKKSEEALELKHSGIELKGYTRTDDSQITTTVLGEFEGVRIVEQRIKPGGGTIEYCERCWVDVRTGVKTCVPIACPPARSTNPGTSRT